MLARALATVLKLGVVFRNRVGLVAKSGVAVMLMSPGQGNRELASLGKLVVSRFLQIAGKVA
jgi:hypothetical protein